MDREILLKEKASVKSCYINLNKTYEVLSDVEKPVYRVYRLNRLMSHLQIIQPIPYVMKGFQTVDIWIDQT